MSLLQPPMHSAMVSKMCSDLMSTALGTTLLRSKAEQWEEEAKSAQSWWLVSCPLAVQQSTKYLSLQWGKGAMKLEWGLQIRCQSTLQINQCTSKSLPLSAPQISLDLKLKPHFSLLKWVHFYLGKSSDPDSVMLSSECWNVFLCCTSPSYAAIAAAMLIKCSSVQTNLLCFGHWEKKCWQMVAFMRETRRVESTYKCVLLRPNCVQKYMQKTCCVPYGLTLGPAVSDTKCLFQVTIVSDYNILI